MILIAEWLVRRAARKAEQQFSTVAPPEQAEFTVTETDVTMKSPSATVMVPLNKVTGLALGKEALAIGFSGSGMIVPRNVFTSAASETEFLVSLIKGMTPEALQRSSEPVRKLV